MKEKHEFGQRQKGSLTPEKLAHILRQTTVKNDAAETFERLIGEKIPEKERGTDEGD